MIRLSDGEDFSVGYCPRFWAYETPQDVAWMQWVMMAMALSRDGNLSVLLPAGAQFTCRALAALSVGLGEVAAAKRDAEDEAAAEVEQRRAAAAGRRP